MKNLCTSLLGLCLMLFTLCASAQTIPINEPDYNKPKLFQDLPERIEFNPSNLLGLFQLQIGQSATIPLTANFNLIGQVVSTANDHDAISVVIRSTNRPGATLTFTKIKDSENNIKYIGRIISLQHGDSYEIIYENNQYSFKKKGLYD